MRNQILDSEGNDIYIKSDVSKTFMSQVFGFMFLALLLSAGAAYTFGTIPNLFMYLINPETGSYNILGWISMLAPLGLVMFMSFRFEKITYSSLVTLFVIFSLIMGVSLSSIFIIYDINVIVNTFLITSGTFGVMALIGYTTNTDLSKFGSIMMMGVIGIIIASVVNIFLGSQMMDFIISIIGVLVFTGLTAYDMQKLKHISMNQTIEGENKRKLAVYGALNLYLDFVNLFLFLLRIFGNSRD